MNLYAYVGNDPLNKTDPTGTEGETCGPNNTVCVKTPEIKAPTVSLTVLKTGGKTAQGDIKVSVDLDKKKLSMEVGLKTKDVKTSTKTDVDAKTGK